MVKRILGLFCAVIIFGLLGCGGGGVKSEDPAWALDTASDGDYYYFVGYAEDIATATVVKDKAFEKAKSQAVSFIFQEASVEQAFNTVGSLSDDSGLQSTYKEAVISKSAASFGGLEIDKVEARPFNEAGLEGNRVWVRAKILKSTVVTERQRIISEMKRKLELVEQSVREAEDALAEGNAVKAINAYVKAIISASKVEERKDEVLIYVNLAGQVLQKITIEPDPAAPKTLDISSSTEIKFTVYYNSDSGKTPVKNVNVLFTLRDNTGDYNRNAVSDAEGNALCRLANIREVNTSTKLYATLSLDFPELLNLGKDFQSYYLTLKDYVGKTQSGISLRTASEANKKITTAVVSMVNDNGNLKPIPNLTSEILAQLQSRGYKVVKFPSGLSLTGAKDLDQSVLDSLAAAGVKRVFVLYVDSDGAPSYKESIKKYVGFYAVSAVLVDTSTGEVFFSKNLRMPGNADNPEAVFGSFVSAAANELQGLVE